MNFAGIRSFSRKGQMIGMGLALGSTLLVQSAGASTAAAAEGTAKKGDYCSSWAEYQSPSGLVRGKVRTCLGWRTDAWHIMTHTKEQAAYLMLSNVWGEPSERFPANWTAVGTVQINSKESISYSHKKKQVTHGGGDTTTIKQGIRCGNRTVTRTYTQVGPLYGADDVSSLRINSGKETLNIKVPCV
ncbi:hypothetical protein ACFRMN_23530 [Streptomyces sp. NPDC056835]|uniref:hypothetical protein n=1 Tax=Streptomyces sp. NPDC056835 TaxID=3345956 RepID=UPI0036A152F6